MFRHCKSVISAQSFTSERKGPDFIEILKSFAKMNFFPSICNFSLLPSFVISLLLSFPCVSISASQVAESKKRKPCRHWKDLPLRELLPLSTEFILIYNSKRRIYYPAGRNRFTCNPSHPFSKNTSPSVRLCHMEAFRREDSLSTIYGVANQIL